jgi:hypothetical protein
MTRLNNVPTADYMGFYFTDGTKYYFGGTSNIEGEVAEQDMEIMWRNLRAAWYLESKRK